MRKVYITVVPALVLILLFTACAAGAGKDTVPGIKNEEPKTGEPVEDEKYSILKPEEAKEMIGKEGVFLVDVRTAKEYAEGYIPGAILLPLDELSKKAETVLPDKDSTIIVYCRSGRRSANALRELKEMGYGNVYDLGGIQSWPYETVKKT